MHDDIRCDCKAFLISPRYRTQSLSESTAYVFESSPKYIPRIDAYNYTNTFSFLLTCKMTHPLMSICLSYSIYPSQDTIYVGYVVKQLLLYFMIKSIYYIS